MTYDIIYTVNIILTFAYYFKFKKSDFCRFLKDHENVMSFCQYKIILYFEYSIQEIEEISNFEDQEVTPRLTGSRKCNIMYICLVNSLYFEHFRFKNHIHRNNF